MNWFFNKTASDVFEKTVKNASCQSLWGARCTGPAAAMITFFVNGKWTIKWADKLNLSSVYSAIAWLQLGWAAENPREQRWEQEKAPAANEWMNWTTFCCCFLQLRQKMWSWNVALKQRHLRGYSVVQKTSAGSGLLRVKYDIIQ